LAPNSTTPSPRFVTPPPHRQQVDYRITVQMLEIYNESLRDLLADNARSQGRLDILSTQASGCNVPGAVQVRFALGWVWFGWFGLVCWFGLLSGALVAV